MQILDEIIALLSDDAASPRYVRTVRGVGYGMVLA